MTHSTVFHDMMANVVGVALAPQHPAAMHTVRRFSAGRKGWRTARTSMGHCVADHRGMQRTIPIGHAGWKVGRRWLRVCSPERVGANAVPLGAAAVADSCWSCDGDSDRGAAVCRRCVAAPFCDSVVYDCDVKQGRRGKRRDRCWCACRSVLRGPALWHMVSLW